MRSKKLTYNVDITPSLSKLNIIPTDEEIEKLIEKPSDVPTCGEDKLYSVSSDSSEVTLSIKR